MAVIRRIGSAISYFVATVYVLSIALPALYCYQHGCRGPEGDAFMPAFFLTPVGGIASAFCLCNALQNIRKKGSQSWLFWPVAVVFATVLLGVIAFIALLIYHTVLHR